MTLYSITFRVSTPPFALYDLADALSSLLPDRVVHSHGASCFVTTLIEAQSMAEAEEAVREALMAAGTEAVGEAELNSIVEEQIERMGEVGLSNRQKTAAASKGKFWCPRCDMHRVGEHGKCPVCGWRERRKRKG